MAKLRQQLVSYADRIRQMGTERKLATLQACLNSGAVWPQRGAGMSARSVVISKRRVPNVKSSGP